MNDSSADIHHKHPWQRPLLFTSVCLITLIADLLTKWWVFLLPEKAQHIDSSHEAWLWILRDHWADIVWVYPAINKGAAFSIGSGTPWLIIALTVLLVPGVSAYYWLQVRFIKRPWEHLAFALIIGGALGNAWDRLISVVATGYGGVRDFIHFDFNWVGFDYVWPTFNIADCGITIGAAIAIVASLTAKPSQSPAKALQDTSA